MPKDPTLLASLTSSLPLPDGMAKDIAKQVEQAIPAIKAIPADVGSHITHWGTSLVLAFGIILAGWLAARWLMQRAHHALTKAKVNETPAQFLASALRFVIILTAFVLAIVQLGVPVQSLWALMGGLALAIGLGLKDTLTNVAAGIMLLINRPFEADDYIQIGELQGIVKRINLFQTELNTRDNLRIAFPNKTIWESPIINHTHNRVRMVEVFVGLGYDTPTAECTAAIRKAVESHKLVLHEPTPFIGIHTLGNSAVEYIVRVWVKTTDYPFVRYGLLGDIKAEVDKRGIAIPYPQHVVHKAKAPPTIRKKP
jgi:small conductance mechanosensitive channel